VNESQRRRFAENEALYRSVNERIESITNAVVTDRDETMQVICECGFFDCTEMIRVTIAEYERVRADPTLFIVVPGHETREVETVAEEHESYSLVRKDRPEGREVALATDPRART
jgi:hypothetical protein